jgi:ABC-type dipeptide/oligopeptide/nickel transport system permease subunit
MISAAMTLIFFLWRSSRRWSRRMTRSTRRRSEPDATASPRLAGEGSPVRRFWLGTDDQGRDVFSTILYGSRISLIVGFASVASRMVLGITLGLVAGYVGGWVETFIMRVADVQLTFPAILMAMLIFGIAKGVTPPEYRTRWRSGC